MMGHYTTRATCNSPFPGHGIKAFQSNAVWYGQSRHDSALEYGIRPNS